MARSPSRRGGYSAIVFRPPDLAPIKVPFGDPLDALAAAVEYLKDGFQVRLSDPCAEWFRALPEPDLGFAELALRQGQRAALSGPPHITTTTTPRGAGT
jgi:hypothetical protein